MNDAPKPNVVIDTQIYLRATVNPDSISGKIIFQLRYLYILVVSPEILSEIKDVLSRPKLRRKFKTLTDDAVAAIMTEIESAISVVLEDVPQVSRDPKDDIFLATAVAAKAQYIVSEDNDLLTLNPYEGIRILNALDFLRVLQLPSE